MKSQATRVQTAANIPTKADSAYAIGIRQASQAAVASVIIVAGGIVMAYAGVGLAMWPG